MNTKFSKLFLPAALLLCTVAIIITVNKKDNQMNQDQLIPREVIFGNPDKVAVRLSSDGKHISYLSPKEGVLNVWTAPADDLSAAKVITDEKQRGIRSYFWAKDNEHIIYAQDKKGDENWRLYSVNINSLEQKVLTPQEGIRASVLKLSRKFPNHMLIKLNDRVPEYFDIYKVDIKTGGRELVYENKGEYATFIADDDFKIRVGYKMLPSGEGEIYLFENGDLSKPSLFQKITSEDILNTSPLHISADGSKLFMIDSAGRNTSELIEVDLATKERRKIHADSKADIDDYLVDTKTYMVQAVATEYMRKSWQIIDEKVAADVEFLKSVDDGDMEIASRTYEDGKWVVAFFRSDGPHKYYIYDRDNKDIKFLFTSNSRQENMPFAKMYPLEIKARDGLKMVCYLTIPRWLDDGNGRPSRPVPLVLNVHGGPNARDSWGFSAMDQWLANRGYATLNVNYRGSTGFGKDFTNAGDGEWARKMQTDLEDAVNWAIENGVTEKDKVAIMGGSYGGYATLVGMAMTPDKYVAGIDIVGPSNLVTLLKSVPPYWKPYIARLVKITGGNPETEEGRKALMERSPITYADQIKKPLMIVQGANDPRVKQAESDQIVDAMKKHDIPVVYLLYPDEGHGLARPENRFSMYTEAEAFLAKFLGGRFEKSSGVVEGSTMQIIEGKDLLEELGK